MKKLSLLVVSLLVCLMASGQNQDPQSNDGLGIPYTLNPYAYDLSSTWNEETQELTVHFTLNSPPNLDDGEGADYNEQHAEPNGLQLFAVDPEGNKYRIGGPGRATIRDNHKENGGQYNLLIELADGVTAKGNEQPTRLDIPRGVPLTWEVWVKGRSAEPYTVPRFVNATVDKQPYKMAGVAIGTNPYAENFAKTFIANTDNGGGLQNDATYGWLYTALQGEVAGTSAVRTPALLEYTASLKYNARHRKGYHDDEQSWFSSQTFAEPHRVRVSEDGHIFVSSYISNVSGDGWAIAEYLGDDKFRTIIKTDYNTNKDQEGNAYAKTHHRFNRRPVDFDVKGSGENLKMVVAWVDPRDRCLHDKFWWAKVECVEYEVGKAEQLPLAQGAGNVVAEYNDYNPDEARGHWRHGLIFQGYAGPERDKDGNKWVSGDKYYNSGNPYTAGQQGFIGVAYGKGENNPIWMKVDFGINKQFPAHILYFDNTGNTPTQAKKDLRIPTGYSSSGFYGGHALVVTDKWVITADGRTQPTTNHNKHLLFYDIDEILNQINQTDTLLPEREHAVMVTREQSAAYINGLALDYANNLYIVSAGTNKVYTFGLPYSGKVVTPAPLKSEYTFMLPHLASGLEYHPYYDDVTKKGDKYKFSFNVDVANPTAVEICFYDTKDKMLKGGDDYTFRYSFPAGDCKQGEMSVVFDAVRETRFYDLSLKNTDENEYLNLPRGEYYWNVRVSRNVTIGSETHTQVDATPAPEEYCFLPERLSQGMDAYVMDDIINPDRILKDIAIYRPMKSSYYNTFCLPFDVDFRALDDGHPYKVEEGGATLLEFVGIQLTTLNGETMLELQFNKVSELKANVPYLFKPKEDVNLIMSLNKSLTILENYKDVNDDSHKIHKTDDQGNGVLYWAFLPKREIEIEPGDICLILVDQNRLAQVSSSGTILGLRGIFVLDKPLPARTVARIAEREPITTGLINFNGTQIDVNKFLQEGRVYIRMGDSLYTLDGQKVK